MSLLEKQMRILEAIGKIPCPTRARVFGAADIHNSLVSKGMVDRMEEDGLIIMHSFGDHGRILWLTVTDHGDQVLEKWKDLVQTMYPNRMEVVNQ